MIRSLHCLSAFTVLTTRKCGVPKETSSAMTWQPIQSAPKSGKAILLWWSGCKDPSVGRWEYDGIREGWRCDGDQCVPKNQHDCTHWMPLPSEHPKSAMTPTNEGQATAPASFAAPSGSVRMAHTLKTWGPYLEAIGLGHKTFEIRKDDRGFRVGDILHLREWNPDKQDWGPRSVTCFISYILRDFAGLKNGYCAMGIRLPANHQWPPNTV